jgi:hypothetical protein
MADKRISQLIERTDIANNDVLPIVASGATTTNKVTISTIQDWMQDNLDVGVTSVGLSVPSAFTVSGSPVTTSGNITISGAGTTAQYIRGDGSLADFPSSLGGGGASVSYYLNGSVNQGTIGGVAYRELSKSPILGSGTDFTINADGYIASFITDAGDPSLLEIPGGNWNFETYFQASSGGGTPSFYVELYKVSSGGTATLIATSSGSPELIAFGTNTTPYFSSLAVPTTTLALTDRLAIRYYVAHSGRTITLHTENNTLCQIITTFTTGLTALNGLTAQVQNFATGTSGTDFNISSASTTHTFNLPDASASNRGAVTTGTQTFAGYKIFNGTIGANVDIQLATQGTALNTFIKNINATGQTSIGSNGFGFNNANNIYFSGSSKGGGIIAFNNTGNQTYTLQNASGTLAFTSDLNSYLPLTGGTLTGTLAGTAAVFSGSIDANNGTNSTNGIKVISSLSSSLFTGGIEFLRTTVTAGSKIEPIRDAALGGVGLKFLTTLNNSAESSGTLTTAMTIAPTGGVTLSGALNGTSAVFSGNLEAGKTGGAVTSGDLLIDSTSLSANVYVGRLSSTSNDNTNFIVRNRIGSELFKVTGNTGAATFSSSVTGRNFVINEASANRGGLYPYNLVSGSGTDYSTGIYSEGEIFLASGGSATKRFTMSSTGAATFSGSVTAASYVNGIGGFRLKESTLGGGSRNWVLGNDVSVFGDFGILQSTTQTGSTYTAPFYINPTGSVGIGTTSPAGYGTTLQIASGSGIDTSFVLGDGVGTTTNRYFAARPGSSGNFLFGTDVGDISFRTGLNPGTSVGTERMRITSGGHVLINRTNISSAALAGSATLQVNNEFISTGTNAGLFWENRSGGVTTSSNWYGWYTTAGTIFLYNGSANAASINPSTGAYTALSDENKKKDFKESTIGLNEVLNLKPTLYRMKDDESEGEKELGFIAQEVKEFIPQAYVEGGEEDAKFIGLNYNAIVAALVKSVQELKAEIDSLKTK